MSVLKNRFLRNAFTSGHIMRMFIDYMFHFKKKRKRKLKKNIYSFQRNIFTTFFSFFCNCVDRNKKRVVKLKRRKTNFLSFECSCKCSCMEMHSCLFESLSLLSFFVFLQTLTDIGCFLFLHISEVRQ